MATLSNFDGTMEFIAPAGGAVAFTPIVEATTLKVSIPLFAAVSGLTYTGVCYGRVVRGIAKTSATAYLSGAALTIKTTGFAEAQSVAGIINAYAYGPALSTNTTMDVLLVLPISVA